MGDGRVRMRSVVVATDFSPGAAAALRRAALLPLEREATLWIVHVLPESLPDAFAGAVRERAHATLREAAAELGRAAAEHGERPAVECALLAGKAHVEVIREARLRAAELVVMGRHGEHGPSGALIGSTAERVIRKGDVPVLLARRGTGGPYRRALVAIDLSDASRRVVDLALALLPEDVREIALVHARHVAFERWFGESALAALRREQAERAAQAAGGLAAIASAQGVECRLVTLEGDPRIAVLRQAEQERSDLIVLGTHGRAGVSHALLGSVAGWLVRNAPCDVAVTRPARFTFELP